MARTAINRTSFRYYAGVPKTLPTGEWIINPDLSTVAGVEQQYWKVDGDSVVEMTQAEKNAVDKLRDSNKTAPDETKQAFARLEDYPNVARVLQSEIQYAQKWFNRRDTIVGFETFVEEIENGTSIKFGLYEQSELAALTGIPTNKLVESTGVAVTQENSFVSSTLETPYEIPFNGYYWIAMINDATDTRVASTLAYTSGIASLRFENSSALTLPSGANSEIMRSSALYVSSILEA